MYYNEKKIKGPDQIDPKSWISRTCNVNIRSCYRLVKTFRSLSFPLELGTGPELKSRFLGGSYYNVISSNAIYCGKW